MSGHPDMQGLQSRADTIVTVILILYLITELVEPIVRKQMLPFSEVSLYIASLATLD